MRGLRAKKKKGARGEKKKARPAYADRRKAFRRKTCKLCADRVDRLDFQDTLRLSKFTSERGKILPRRISGNCARHQRQLAKAVKRARAIALMPYVTVE